VTSKRKELANMIGKYALAAFGASALALASGAPAQDLSPELKAFAAKLPGTLIDDPTRLDWATQGTGFKSRGVTDPAIPGGGAAIHFEIPKADPKAYSIQAFVPLTSRIAKGDTVTVGFYARALSADTPDGKGTINVRFQQNSDPWPGFGDKTVQIGPAWEWHEVSAVANIAVPKETAVVALQLAGAKQTIEIGQTIVIAGAASILGAASAAPAEESTLAVLAKSVELPPQLKDAGRLIDRPDLRNWTNSPAGSAVDRDDKTIWLGKATRYTVAAKGQNRWDVGATIPLLDGIAEGDKLIVAFAARTVSAGTADGKALVGVRVQSNDPPYDGFADHLVAVGPNWQLIRIETVAAKAIPAGKAAVALQFAEAPQVVDIGPVYVLKGN
jgi:hypothetical protein